MRIPLGNTGNERAEIVLLAIDAMCDTRNLAFNSLVTEIQTRQCQHACVSETKHHRRFWRMLRGSSASRRTGSAYRSHLIYDTRVFREESTRTPYTKAEKGLAYRNTRDAYQLLGISFAIRVPRSNDVPAYRSFPSSSNSSADFPFVIEKTRPSRCDRKIRAGVVRDFPFL